MKPLNLGAQLRTKRQTAKLLTTTPDGKFVFQVENGSVIVTDVFGFAGDKQRIFDSPPVRKTSKFAPGETCYYVRFQAQEKHLIPVRFIGMSEKPGVAYVDSLDPQVQMRNRNDAAQKSKVLIGSLYKTPQEVETVVLSILASVRALMGGNKPQVVTRKNGETRI